MYFRQTVPLSWRRATSGSKLTWIKFPSSQRLNGNRYGATGILENWRAAVCLGDATRGGTKCCGWWRSWRCCFINSGSTSNLQLGWLNTETRHIKPARSTSWLNRRQPSRRGADKTSDLQRAAEEESQTPEEKHEKSKFRERERRRRWGGGWHLTQSQELERSHLLIRVTRKRSSSTLHFKHFLQRCSDRIADPWPPPTKQSTGEFNRHDNRNFLFKFPNETWGNGEN